MGFLQIRMQDAVQAAAAAEERRIRADNYQAVLMTNMQLAEARAARDAADRQSELMRSEAELSATLADPYLGEDPSMAASSLSAYRWLTGCDSITVLMDTHLAASFPIQMPAHAAAGYSSSQLITIFLRS